MIISHINYYCTSTFIVISTKSELIICMISRLLLYSNIHRNLYRVLADHIDQRTTTIL